MGVSDSTVAQVQPQSYEVTMFNTHWVKPSGETTLASRQWLPLPPTDFCFYPMVNSWLIPHSLDTEKFKQAVAQALCIYPLNAAELKIHPQMQKWQLCLSNRSIPVTIGRSPRPGPFSPNWKGETDPDYYSEMPRSGADLALYSDGPLCKVLVTTYEKTEETSIMLSQSYNLGDGFCVMGFIKAIGAYYNGTEPDFIPTFEKYLLPETKLVQSASHHEELQYISWLAASFTDEEHERRAREMHHSTTRVEVDIPAAFVYRLKTTVAKETGMTRLSAGDAFGGYLASILVPMLGPSVKYLQQCIGFRTKSLKIGGTWHQIPLTSQGTCYLIGTTNLFDRTQTDASSMTKALYNTRQALADDTCLSKVYAMYNHLYNVAALSKQTPFDCGHKDGLAFNNCTKLDLTNVDFGVPGQTNFIEWEVLENFVQFQHTGARRQRDGSYVKNPGDLTLVTRLQHHIVPRFLRRLERDTRSYREGSLRSWVLNHDEPELIRSQL